MNSFCAVARRARVIRMQINRQFISFRVALGSACTCACAPVLLQAQSLEYVNSTLYGGLFKEIQVVGDFAYLGTSSSFQVVSLDDPIAPVVIGGYPFLRYMRSAFVEGEYAYIVDGEPLSSEYLAILDISDPAHEILVSYGSIAAWGGDIEVRGDYAFVTANLEGIVIMDISNPLDPFPIASYDTPGEAFGIFLSGQYAFVTDSNGGLQIVDVSDPTDPFFVGMYNTRWEAYRSFVDGGKAYVAEGLWDIAPGAIEIVDVSDPWSPSFLGRYESVGAFLDVQVSGNFAYATNYMEFGSDYLVIDVSDPSEPFLAGSYHEPNGYRDVCVAGEYTYVGGNQLVDIFRTDDTSEPSPVATYRAGHARAVAISGDYAYVTAEKGGLWIVDISHVEAPVVTGHYWVEGTTSDLFVSGHYAYMPVRYSGLNIVDVTEPSNPALTGVFPAERFGNVFVQGDYAYVTGSWEGLFILDVSDRSEPMLVTTYDADGYENDVFVEGDHAYLSVVSEGQLQVINVADPSDPFLEGYSDAPNSPLSVFVADGYAYMADRWQGVRIFNVEDPANPFLATTYDSPGYAYNVKVFGAYALVADDSAGVEMLDITDPANPGLVTSYDSPGQAKDVCMVDNHLLVADSRSLMILHFYPETGIGDNEETLPNEFGLMQNYPNPFNSQTSIRIAVPQPSYVNLSIYDILGRMVDRLVSKNLQSGYYSIHWNGRDEAGEELPSGIYFCVLESKAGSVTRRMLLVR